MDWTFVTLISLVDAELETFQPDPRVVRVFVKKTRNTPASEIQLALKRAQEITQ